MDNADILAKFLATYPEFKPVLQTADEQEVFFSQVAKIKCLYSEFANVSDCLLYPFLALIAHYFVIGGFSASIGIVGTQGGVVASSSVGDVSVSYQSNPVATKGDEFTYFLSLTKYGMEYLAWLKRQAGLVIVN